MGDVSKTTNHQTIVFLFFFVCHISSQLNQGDKKNAAISTWKNSAHFLMNLHTVVVSDVLFNNEKGWCSLIFGFIQTRLTISFNLQKSAMNTHAKKMEAMLY